MDNNLVTVTSENVVDETLFCSKNVKESSFKAKQAWLDELQLKGLHLKILKNEMGKPIGFIEFLPAEISWRPVHAPNYLFIHCMYVAFKKDRGKGYGRTLIQSCISDARKLRKRGVGVMTSDGPWLADKRLFLENGFVEVDQRGRFELMAYTFNPSAPDPHLLNWTKEQPKYKGWHLLYADQCPWHQKAVDVLQKIANEQGVRLKIKRLQTPSEAQHAPSGFGVFSLLHDGRLLEDHYISGTRFKSILKEELATTT